MMILKLKHGSSNSNPTYIFNRSQAEEPLIVSSGSVTTVTLVELLFD